MWRSFFFAAGIYLIMLGFQTLAIDEFNVVNFRRIPKIVANKALGYMDSSQPSIQAPPNLQGFPQMAGQTPNLAGQAPNLRPPQQGNRPAANRSAFGPSAYGPSRYQGTQSGAFNRITSNRTPVRNPTMPQVRPPYQQAPSAGGQFGLAGYQSPGQIPAQRATQMGPPIGINSGNSPRFQTSRTIKTQDWMPWSLLAAGTMIVLSSSRRRYGGDE